MAVSRRLKTAPTAPVAHRRTTRPVSADLPAISRDMIATEAYLLFMARGGQDGDAVNDWLTAERIVRERLGQAVAAKPPAARRRKAGARASA
jgi:hypothetical protein